VREAERILEVSAPATADVDADFERVEQALGNLVENALNHGDGTIRLSAETHDGLVELHVRDEGPGFPGEFLDLAFDRFTQADTARSVAGTGLGLPIAEAIAGAHGGSAQAVNRSGSGADVWLSLPAA
jgi:signal transduction histidine kinase